jgi:hypothetical protein
MLAIIESANGELIKDIAGGRRNWMLQISIPSCQSALASLKATMVV